MLKYLAVVALAFAAPAIAAADPVVPGVGITTITVDSVTASKDGAHMVVVHKGSDAVEVLIGGCPAPKADTDYYLIGIPEVGVFAAPKKLMDTSLAAHKGDFADASKEVLDAKQMCVVVGARAVPKV